MQVINQVFKQNYFKSAMAFFFLFFLHGTSIGTRQQGISYNGIGLYAVRNNTQKMIRSTTVIILKYF